MEGSLEREERGDEPEDEVALPVRRETAREEPDHDQRGRECAPDSNTAGHFALARTAGHQPLDDREPDKGGPEELRVEAGFGTGRPRNSKRASQLEASKKRASEASQIASRPRTSRGGSRRSTRRGYNSTEHLGATWFRRGRFSGRAASRGPRSAS
jgi:hypothetical protein